jgi:hypothetical protein
MKKTTPAIIATFLITTIIGGSMFLVGLDATRTQAAAAVPSTIVNIHTAQSLPNTTAVQTVSTTSSRFSPLLRTGGS